MIDPFETHNFYVNERDRLSCRRFGWSAADEDAKAYCGVMSTKRSNKTSEIHKTRRKYDRH